MRFQAGELDVIFGETKMKTYAEIDKMTISETIREFDKVAKHTVNSIDFWSNEVFRKTLKKQNQEMSEMTNTIKILTCVITGLTLLNVVVGIILLINK